MDGRLWLLNCAHRIAGYDRQPNRPRLRTAPSGDAQTRRVARPRGHAESHPRIARHAADAGCSACFSSDTGVAAVELLNSEFAFCAFPLPESLVFPN